MTMKINKAVLAALTLAILVSMFSVLAPGALADSAPAEGGDTVKDTVTITESGKVTLTSQRLAAEKVSSLQMTFTAADDTGFTFDNGLPGYHHTGSATGELTIYVAGTEPLMTAAGQTITLGTISDKNARLVEGSVGYVYGTQIRWQVVNAVYEVKDETTKKQELAALIAEAQALLDSGELGEIEYGLIRDAVMAAQAMLDDTSITDDSKYEDAYTALYTVLNQTATGGTLLEALKIAINEIEAMVITEDKYDKEGVETLNAALDEARTVRDSGTADESTIQSAIEALETAMKGLKTRGYAALQEALRKAQGMLDDKNKEYEANSRTALENAVKAGQGVLDGEKSTPEDMDAAAAAINDAIDRLTEISGGGSGVIGGEGEGEGGEGGSGGSGGTTSPTATAPASSIPATGDETPVLLWMAVLCLCGGLLAVLLRRVKTRG